MSGMILGLLGVLILAWLWFARRRAGEVGKSGALSAYHSVGLQAGAPCCQAVRGLGPRRFLSGEAPLLPLAGCTVAACRCKYVHFDDRRTGERREGSGPRVRNLQAVNWMERRRARGRRKTDQRRGLDEYAMKAAVAEKRRRRAAETRSPLSRPK